MGTNFIKMWSNIIKICSFILKRMQDTFRMNSKICLIEVLLRNSIKIQNLFMTSSTASPWSREKVMRGKKNAGVIIIYNIIVFLWWGKVMRKKGKWGFNYHLAQFSLKLGFTDIGCINEPICFLEGQELLKIHLYLVYMYYCISYPAFTWFCCLIFQQKYCLFHLQHMHNYTLDGTKRTS